MKYKTIKLASHPRSGSHWVMRLIDKNFFDGMDYLKHYGGHPFGNEVRSLGYFKKPHQAVIYTYRNQDSTADSIYRMRHRFGLDQDDYEKFVNTPMKDMYNKKLKVDTIRDTLKETTSVEEVDWLFGNRPETVFEYTMKHKTSWDIHNGQPNFMKVSYDDLVSDFQGTMLQIAQFLGSDKTEFIDEQQRVGWRSKSDDAWKKP